MVKEQGPGQLFSWPMCYFSEPSVTRNAGHMLTLSPSLLLPFYFIFIYLFLILGKECLRYMPQLEIQPEPGYVP